MNRKQILALCCSLLFLISTAGCGRTVRGNETDTAAVNAAMKQLENCISCTVLQITEISESLVEDGSTYEHNGTTEMEITLITEPKLKMKNENRSQAVYDGQEVNQQTISYILPENGGYREYYFDGTGWYYVFVEDEESIPDIRVTDLVSLFMLDVEAFGKVRAESLDGGAAIRYDANLGGTSLVTYMESNGYLSSITSMSENQQNRIKSNLAEDLDSLTLSVWVDEKSGYPVRFELDLSHVLVQLEEIIAESLGNLTSDSQWTLSKYSITMILSDLDAIEELTIPPEAESAIPYDQSSLA